MSMRHRNSRAIIATITGITRTFRFRAAHRPVILGSSFLRSTRHPARRSGCRCRRRRTTGRRPITPTRSRLRLQRNVVTTRRNPVRTVRKHSPARSGSIPRWPLPGRSLSTTIIIIIVVIVLGTILVPRGPTSTTTSMILLVRPATTAAGSGAATSTAALVPTSVLWCTTWSCSR